MAESARYGSVPFELAISFLKQKLNLPSESWTDVWADAHNSAFMVAGAMEDDLLNDFRKAVDIAISEGKSIGWFKKEFNNIVSQHGWDFNGGKDWRARIIYDTNIRQSYNAGRWQQLQEFDYWEYQHGDSVSPRPMHLSWHGLTLHKDSPFWLTHFPSNGWGCKCKVRGRRKGTDQPAPDIEYREFVDKNSGEVHKVPKGIDPGFEYAPHSSAQQKQQKARQEKSAQPYQPPERLVPTAFSSVKNANVHTLNDKLTEFKTAAPQLKLLSEFISKHDIKTLFVKTSEMKPRSKAARRISSDVVAYLPDGLRKYGYNNYCHEDSPNGWTASSLDHITVKLTSSANFKKVDINELINAVEVATLVGKDNISYTLSAIVRQYGKSGDNGGAIITWLHEMGHQVHFKAGGPLPPVNRDISLTRYGSDKDVEWFAEHFAAWVLNRQALADWNNEIAVYFDNLIEEALK